MDPKVVRSVLERMHTYLSDLRSFVGTHWLEYCDNSTYRYAVERLMQLLVECAMDINNHLLTDKGLLPGSSYADSFKKAAENHFIPMDLALRFKPALGLRNTLVHRYRDIDDKIVFDSIPHLVQDIEEYIRAVSKMMPGTAP